MPIQNQRIAGLLGGDVHCPRCDSRNVAPGTPRVWETPYQWLMQRTLIRCHVCRWRGWRSDAWLRDATAARTFEHCRH